MPVFHPRPAPVRAWCWRPEDPQAATAVLTHLPRVIGRLADGSVQFAHGSDLQLHTLFPGDWLVEVPTGPGRTGLQCWTASAFVANFVEPFDPERVELSEHDLIELVAFAAQLQTEDYEHVLARHRPSFDNVDLSSHVNGDPQVLPLLLDVFGADITAFWQRSDARDLYDAHTGRV